MVLQRTLLAGVAALVLASCARATDLCPITQFCDCKLVPGGYRNGDKCDVCTGGRVPSADYTKCVCPLASQYWDGSKCFECVGSLPNSDGSGCGCKKNEYQDDSKKCVPCKGDQTVTKDGKGCELICDYPREYPDDSCQKCKSCPDGQIAYKSKYGVKCREQCKGERSWCEDTNSCVLTCKKKEYPSGDDCKECEGDQVVNEAGDGCELKCEKTHYKSSDGKYCIPCTGSKANYQQNACVPACKCNQYLDSSNICRDCQKGWTAKTDGSGCIPPPECPRKACPRPAYNVGSETGSAVILKDIVDDCTSATVRVKSYISKCGTSATGSPVDSVVFSVVDGGSDDSHYPNTKPGEPRGKWFLGDDNQYQYKDAKSCAADEVKKDKDSDDRMGRRSLTSGPASTPCTKLPGMPFGEYHELKNVKCGATIQVYAADATFKDYYGTVASYRPGTVLAGCADSVCKGSPGCLLGEFKVDCAKVSVCRKICGEKKDKDDDKWVMRYSKGEKYGRGTKCDKKEVPDKDRDDGGYKKFAMTYNKGDTYGSGKPCSFDKLIDAVKRYGREGKKYDDDDDDKSYGKGGNDDDQKSGSYRHLLQDAVATATSSPDLSQLPVLITDVTQVNPCKDLCKDTCPAVAIKDRCKQPDDFYKGLDVDVPGAGNLPSSDLSPNPVTAPTSAACRSACNNRTDCYAAIWNGSQCFLKGRRAAYVCPHKNNSSNPDELLIFSNCDKL